MTWLVFALSGLLVLAGAVSVISGAPIIQLERGWAEVISGTVAMSGGCVVFALGVMLMRLESLRDAMSRVPDRPAPAFAEQGVALAEPTVPAADPGPSSPAPEPATDTPEVPTTEPAVAAAETNQGLWKRIKRRSGAETANLSDAALSPDPIASEPSAALSASTTNDPEPDDRPEPAVAAAPLPEPKASEEAGQLGWLDRSLLKTRAAAPRPREAARVEPSLIGFGFETAPEPAVGHDRAAAVGELTPHAVPADEGPTVIGRYQAGVASYVMYSDGTIEVETDSGQSHRFNSMDELKDFIAKQDQPES